MAVSTHMPIPPVRSSYAGTERVMCWDRRRRGMCPFLPLSFTGPFGLLKGGPLSPSTEGNGGKIRWPH